MYTFKYEEMPLDKLAALAERGDADAQYEYGLLFEMRGHDPEDEPSDWVSAAEWYRKAVAQGHEAAIRDLYKLSLRAQEVLQNGSKLYSFHPSALKKIIEYGDVAVERWSRLTSVD